MAELTDVLNEYAHTLYTGLKEAVPTDLELVEDLPFDKANEQGGDYTQHIIVAEEAGFVHGDPTEMMNAPTAVALETVKAIVNGYQVGIVSTLDYAKAQRASNSRKAYADIAGKKQASGFNAIRKRVEDELWWGQIGIGKCASSVNGGGAGTTTTITLTLAHWAPWIWAGKKNYQVVAYNSATKVGTAGFTITATAVNRDVRTVVVSGTNADITALDAAILANPDIVDLYWSGTATSTGTIVWKTMVGAMKAAQTTTGTLFNVDLDANTDARPNTFGAGGAMSFAKCLQAAEVLIGRGVVEPIKATFSPRTWDNMMTDQAALVRYNGKQGKFANGASKLEFEVQGVQLEISASGRMKEGYGLLRPKSGLKRIGARDISMVTPGGSNAQSKGDIWYHDPSRFGYSWRIWTHQAFFPEEPWKLLSVTGIVNT
jgi:hypothetical protein